MKKNILLFLTLISFLTLLIPNKVMALKMLAPGSEIWIPLELKETEFEITAGQSGKLELADINGLEVQGEFVPWENEAFRLEKDGSWQAFAEFNLSLTVTVIFTEDSLKQLQEAHPDYVVTNPEVDHRVNINISYKTFLDKMLHEVYRLVRRDLIHLKLIE
ncbi:hypothetical protein [Vagococcus salmoninarum]|uniref:hypothetical protein n=1 Tax=Vagococcus salmoninarum TaxID=2739 RepID=UPI003F9B9E2C